MMAHLKVAAFTKLFWPEGGGAELATYLVVKDVLSKHYDVVIVSGTEMPKADILGRCRRIHWSALKAKHKPSE